MVQLNCIIQVYFCALQVEVLSLDLRRDADAVHLFRWVGWIKDFLLPSCSSRSEDIWGSAALKDSKQLHTQSIVQEMISK